MGKVFMLCMTSDQFDQVTLSFFLQSWNELVNDSLTFSQFSKPTKASCLFDNFSRPTYLAQHTPSIAQAR